MGETGGPGKQPACLQGVVQTRVEYVGSGGETGCEGGLGPDGKQLLVIACRTGEAPPLISSSDTLSGINSLIIPILHSGEKGSKRPGESGFKDLSWASGSRQRAIF